MQKIRTLIKCIPQQYKLLRKHLRFSLSEIYFCSSKWPNYYMRKSFENY